jgi:hypothetical protein
MLTKLCRPLRNRDLNRKTTSAHQNYIESDLNTKVAAGRRLRDTGPISAPTLKSGWYLPL